jgi:hypothetical protein
MDKITPLEFQCIYERSRYDEVVRRMKDQKDVTTWHAQASMVPFIGGQALLVNYNSFPVFQNDVEFMAASFIVCDGANDSDLELPPHGKISKVALPNAMQSLTSNMQSMKMVGLDVNSLMLGQGLVEYVKKVKKLVVQIYPDLHVYPSQHTHASTELEHNAQMYH